MKPSADSSPEKLDFSLPPGVEPDEVRRRMKIMRENCPGIDPLLLREIAIDAANNQVLSDARGARAAAAVAASAAPGAPDGGTPPLSSEDPEVVKLAAMDVPLG